MIRYDRLQAFAVFADELSFTRAAQRLHLSQPALHVQVQQLAEELGVVLYTREGRSLRLTADGARVRAFARDLEEQTARFLAELRGGPSPSPVVLCAGEAVTRYVLSQALRAFRHPVRLTVGDAETTLRAVQEGRAHVGVAGAAPQMDGLLCTPLLSVPQTLAVRADHALASRDRVDLTELAGSALVVPPPGRPHRVALERALVDVPYEIAAEVHGWDLMLQLVEAGLGLAVVNGFVPPPTGVRLVPVRDLPPVRYDLVLRAGSVGSGAVRELVEAVREAAAAVGARLPGGQR
jgi:DNA-binding transcriptional LysR family regulator